MTAHRQTPVMFVYLYGMEPIIGIRWVQISTANRVLINLVYPSVYPETGNDWQ